MIRKIKLELRVADVESLVVYLRRAVEELRKASFPALPGNKRSIILHEQMAALLWQKLYKKYGSQLAKGKQPNDPVKLTLTYPEAYYLELLLLMEGVPFEYAHTANVIVGQLDQQLL